MQFDPSKSEFAPAAEESATPADRKDMRTWIADLEAAGELIRIDKPVDPLTEMGSLLYQSREKALLFEKLLRFDSRDLVRIRMRPV
jgi:3-polyprenyl-4-hydroxybenzoate decarboxylase